MLVQMLVIELVRMLELMLVLLLAPGGVLGGLGVPTRHSHSLNCSQAKLEVVCACPTTTST